MPGVLDFTLKPGVDPSPDVPGKAPGLYRDDPWSHTLNFKTGDDALPMPGTFVAQIRAARVGDTDTPGDPLAVIDVDMTDADPDGVLVLNLTREQTRDLDLKAGVDGFWDLQDDDTGETWITGKLRIFDDVTRE